MNPPTTAGMIGRILQSIRTISFNAEQARADAVIHGEGEPHTVIEVRHPVQLPDGSYRLVGVINLFPRAELVWARPLYREALQRQLDRAIENKPGSVKAKW